MLKNELQIVVPSSLKMNFSRLKPYNIKCHIMIYFHFKFFYTTYIHLLSMCVYITLAALNIERQLLYRILDLIEFVLNTRSF